MDTSTLLENQLLLTKFHVPVAPGRLVTRPRLATLLDQSLVLPLTLVSAPAGFGKTTLLADWGHALPANNPRLAWISLDEEDNEPRLFWTYVLTTLNRLQPQRFTQLLTQLQSPQAPPFKHLLAMFINLLAESTDHFLLILDDYQVITEQQIHSTLSYLVEYLPPQLRIILSTRSDPPLSLPQMQARRQILEVRTNQLRCTVEETKAFFKEIIGIQMPDETIQEVAVRTEGWLVGLQLLGLSLPEHADPLSLLEQVSGNQRYILDYLTEVVLQRQPQEVQNFLLSTCILERLTASLCDAVTQQTGSQQLLQQLEQANLFVASLDSRRQWYRYHALFAEALCHRLEQTQGNLVPILHHRASLWYAKHDQTTQAILHAFHAKEWGWSADLIEQQLLPLLSQTWGISKHTLAMIQEWLKQLPADIVHSRPRLCLASALLLFQVAPYSVLEGWLDVAEAALTALLTIQDVSTTIPVSQTRWEQENLLGAVIGLRAVLKTYGKDGHAALPLCQQALGLLSAENGIVRALISWTQCLAYYTSVANNAVATVETGLQAVSLARATGQTTLAIATIGTLAMYMIGPGRLRESYQLSLQARKLGTQPGGLVLPEVGYPAFSQVEVLREQNKLDVALSLTREAISLCQQTESMVSLVYLLYGYAMLLRVSLSRGDLDEARSALQQFEGMITHVNQPTYFGSRSIYTTVDQVRLWLACGELNRAIHWAEQSKITEQHVTAFELERQEVARVRILLAQDQLAPALKLLGPILQRATEAQRWGHVIEIQLLQALAHQMCQQEAQALDTLSEAVRLAEPEGYIRIFVDEGNPMATLLYRLRKRDLKSGPTPYLDTLLDAFQQEGVKQVGKGKQPLPEPLSKRELEVLQLLARGMSNLEIAQELVLTTDTVKRHVSHIFSKLGTHNRMQAIIQAQELDLLDEEH